MNFLNDAFTQNNSKRKEKGKIINHKKCKIKKERKEKKKTICMTLVFAKAQSFNP